MATRRESRSKTSVAAASGSPAEPRTRSRGALKPRVRAAPESGSRAAPAPPVGGRLPGTYRAFVDLHPELGAAHERIARAVERAGPLDARVMALVKIGICVGAGLESALRSHVRRALQHGASRREIDQAILLGMNTVGFPRTVAAWSWARQQFDRRDDGDRGTARIGDPGSRRTPRSSSQGRT